ncbi:sigma-54-dependent Fis family transcriptional regulator [Burkholderia cenocepacia]|uniref:sigma-54-dependent Fis family transcriptional regulator n=1 Tax=Burkholderia cenocepacia TaxID=95486 RepID=UPI002ABE7D4C|nr:sigma 54-interacting transcriptional regulator [Burkholderia cenocepacia]
MPQPFVLPATAGRTDLLAQAHARSTAVGLRAHERPDFSPLSRVALRELLDTNHTLFSHARPVMEDLHAQIAETQSLVLLTDADGVILHSIGDADFIEKANRVALCNGVSWAEGARGTNAIGTALASGQAVVVHGSEHFLRANHILTCACAPIVDPFGRTLGTLDVSGDPRGSSPHTLALVRMSAQLIENHLFANQCGEALRLRFHAHEDCVDSLFAGLVAFGPDGGLIAANRSAQFQLGASFDALQHQTSDALFGMRFAQLAQQAARAPGATFRLTLSTGVRVLARCEFPEAQKTTVAVTPPAPAARVRAPDPDAITFATLDTGDARMAAVLERVAKIRGRDLPLLILGQTGTGKEWLARALHQASPRAVMPLGGARAVPVDVRVVCATHRDLRAMIAEGTFREDLFYRINGLAVTLPALAARTDLPALVERILARLARSEPMPRRLAADVLDAFARHRWPGNLRQMTNVLRTAGMLAEDEAEITLAHLPDDFWLDCDDAPAGPAAATPAASAPSAGKHEGTTLQSHQAAMIDAVLARHGGNVSAAARELGLARNTVYRYLRRH